MHSHHHPSGSHSKENGHSHHHQHSHHHHHHDHLHTEIDLGAQVESSLLQRRYGSFWQNIRKEIGPLIGQAQSRRFVFLLVANLICSVLLFSWCDSTNSIALEAYSYTIWFNFLSLLTSLLSLWVSAKGPSHYYTLGYERFEVLAVFASTVLAQLGALLVAKESVERLLEQPDIHTGRLLLGGGVAFGSHLLVLYGSRNPALEHVMGAASSSWLQDHVSDLSHTLCSAMPPLRSLLLPRINPMLLVSLAGFLSILLTNLLIEIRDYHMMDTLAAFVIIIVTCATMFPMSVYSGKVLLQTTPAHIVGQLDKCLRETLTIDGVLEFRNEHFWTLSFGKLAGSLHVRVRRDADEQKVLAQVIARLSPIVPVLRVQVVKDDWQHSSSSLFSSPQVAFPPSPFTSVQPNNNLLFSGVTSLDPDKFPFKPH
ncbi:zinc transporter 6-A-like [Neocloeon triangulifer]|uniref:zinc transporter 6-A-like n=1 Tax=Neocloeon triangulifer TaxID=2078957 RepID=UPI00286F3466|nr:zinc transporter 6-A-like [Neocloeon triangulifer]